MFRAPKWKGMRRSLERKPRHLLSTSVVPSSRVSTNWNPSNPESGFHSYHHFLSRETALKHLGWARPSSVLPQPPMPHACGSFELFLLPVKVSNIVLLTFSTYFLLKCSPDGPSWSCSPFCAVTHSVNVVSFLYCFPMDGAIQGFANSAIIIV